MNAESHAGDVYPFPLGRGKNQRTRPATGDDLEYALRAAEKLLGQAENRIQHAQNRGFSFSSLILGTLLSLAASVFLVSQYLLEGGASVATAALFFGLVPVVVVLAYWTRKYLEHLRESQADETLRLATEIAVMVGESVVEVAERENWSYLRVRATELRLSAFPLFDALPNRANPKPESRRRAM